jgi:DNA-binding response OmpR family regulator
MNMMNITNHEGPIILLVHDVEETRDGIEKLLKVDGYRVDSVRYEGDAVVTAQRRAPNLIMVNLGGLLPTSSRPLSVYVKARN